MAKYVDGFVLPIPKKNIEAYKKIAKLAAKVWMGYGALDYVECMADDVKPGKTASFPLSVKLKKNEVVFFSWITYKSKRDRDRIVKKVMADPRLSGMTSMPFDMTRMIYGGFQPVVSAGISAAKA